MHKVPLRMYDIGKCEHIQLLESSPAVSMQREEDDPCHETPHAKYNTEDLQKSKEEVTVERGVSENRCIGNIVEVSHPFEPSLGQLLNAFTRHCSVLTLSVCDVPIRTVARDSRGMFLAHTLEGTWNAEI
jgi:hypothetical protein